MSLTKEECLRILESIALNYDAEYVNECHDDFSIYMRNNIKQIKNLIEEHFDNPPLKFEELKENMVVWDNKRKMFIKIFDTATLEENCFSFEVFGSRVPIYDEQFEENRFYRKEVKDDE